MVQHFLFAKLPSNSRKELQHRPEGLANLPASPGEACHLADSFTGSAAAALLGSREVKNERTVNVAA